MPLAVGPAISHERAELGHGGSRRVGAKVREATGIATLKVGYNRVHGYFIEISKGQSLKAPTHYTRRQTLTGADKKLDWRAMLHAMHNAGINADQVDYLNAHGTSTPLGDLNETNAIKAALGDHAKRTVVSSIKSMTGHLLGGAGGIESVFTVLALHHQKAPPTINLFNQDPECDLDYCANTARDMKIDVALKNNFGFGGTNGSLVFKRI